MTEVLLVFKNTSDAVAGERKLLDAGVDAQVIPAPKTMSPGCGICLKINSADIGKVRLILGENMQCMYNEYEEQKL